MARTTLAAVSSAIDTDLTDAQVEAFIDDANAWVTDFLVGEGLTTARLTAIEKYLACHYVTLRDPRLKSGDIEDVSDTYQRNPQVTEYLMQAVAEDSTGIVRAHFIDQKEAGTLRFRVGVFT